MQRSAAQLALVDRFDRSDQIVVLWKVIAMSILRSAILIAAALALSACNGSRPFVYANGSQALVNKTISVARGATAQLGFATAINPDCTHLDLQERIILTQAPGQGRFESRRETGFAYFAPNNPRSRCNTQRVPGTRQIYHANPNGAGTDSFAYDWYTTSGGVVHYVYTVNIL